MIIGNAKLQPLFPFAMHCESRRPNYSRRGIIRWLNRPARSERMTSFLQRRPRDHGADFVWRSGQKGRKEVTLQK
ncbi:hypothetical protein PUN28_014952 [Cardiocondyla obscurior]|uniref:Uncharacterized protein n=1 Tax=Cardiocondyla obscurior TaxID=286306 RepID=A0AAW2EY08_9HYME